MNHGHQLWHAQTFTKAKEEIRLTFSLNGARFEAISKDRAT
jgi:hypothetical protein